MNRLRTLPIVYLSNGRQVPPAGWLANIDRSYSDGCILQYR